MLVDPDKVKEKLAKAIESFTLVDESDNGAMYWASDIVRQADLSDCAVDLEAQLHEAQQAYVSADRRAESQAAEIERLKEDAGRLDRLESRADDWTYKNQKAWSFRGAAHLSLREALDAIDSAKDKS